jgi:hypothetical protein
VDARLTQQGGQMAILDDASVEDKTRLLELFPSAAVKDTWAHIKGNKDDVCEAVASQATQDELKRFVWSNLARCKQHVYVFDRDHHRFALPDHVTSGTKVFSANANNDVLYIIRMTYNVALQEPWENAEIDFLWPVKVQRTPHHVLVRFVSLEKNVASYFDRPCILLKRTIDEDKVLEDLAVAQAGRSDLHKGIKSLWEDKFMDSPRIKFKKPTSVASETMDEERGIRQNSPELYEILKESTLLNALFVIEEEDKCGVSAFSVNCTEGFLAFPRYSKAERNTDFVIEEILARN